MQSAAVALLHGLDPLRVLGLAPDDWRVMVAVVNAAERMSAERAQKLADYTAAQTGNRVAQVIVRAMRG